MRGMTVSKENGAVSVVVAFMMVALLGFAAISIDVGRLYWEKSQLQAGADNAALSIANACATDMGSDDCKDPVGTAAEIAGFSANEGSSGVDEDKTKVTPGRVTVMTTADEIPDKDSVGLWFANIWGFDEALVNATSVAAWGGPTGGTFAFPLAFSECALHEFIAANAASSGKSWLKYKDDADQLPCSSIYHAANIVPGGWGYLDPTKDVSGTSDGTCVLTLDLTVKTVYEGSSGNSIPSNACKTKLQDWVNEADANGYAEVYFPIFSKATGTGGGEFTIQGIAAFRIYAWKLSGGGTPDTFKDSSYPGCSGNCRGIYGEFVRILEEDELTGGGGTDLGVTRPPSLIE
ncbi:pilus assembly protein TadG-related protein [Paeniglutamicibacter psychrophenolicus]|uniref:pilus assembly protein TadG-related protein n=1 Tax=Paeniglutamicibacter psychrophenolicus TaxID=257454 RepID=UPI0027839162|nr:Tad domain-containing protein [Paeniglutamicibacter psychrophenolicus]MDQ0092546.1 hypothetical protein [Paeniglutamicibacter psychrophenolicus]